MDVNNCQSFGSPGRGAPPPQRATVRCGDDDGRGLSPLPPRRHHRAPDGMGGTAHRPPPWDTTTVVLIMRETESCFYFKISQKGFYLLLL